MKRINNKGFTLVEIIAVIVVIALLGMIAIPNVINTINTGKDTSNEILVKDINIAAKQLYEEVEFMNSNLKQFSKNGQTFTPITIDNKKIITNLQTLVSNGFLVGINNPNKDGENKNYKIIINPKNNEDIGDCSIEILKRVDSNFNTSYEIINLSNENDNCPNDY